MPRKLVLASASPRRKKLLKKLHLTFSIQPSEAPETYDSALSPGEIVKKLAWRKAQNVAPKNKQSLVIGADTIVAFQGKILEKPDTPQAAHAMLSEMSNDSHQVFTGLALCKTDKEFSISDSRSFFECTEVLFGKLLDEDIQAYVDTGQPMDKAGAYGIQDDFGARFVTGIKGDYYNVMGLPVHALYRCLRIFAPEYFNA